MKGFQCGSNDAGRRISDGMNEMFRKNVKSFIVVTLSVHDSVYIRLDNSNVSRN
jgi:hypothetical protein